jgi:hypothetical protein
MPTPTWSSCSLEIRAISTTAAPSRLRRATVLRRKMTSCSSRRRQRAHTMLRRYVESFENLPRLFRLIFFILFLVANALTHVLISLVLRPPPSLFSSHRLLSRPRQRFTKTSRAESAMCPTKLMESRWVSVPATLGTWQAEMPRLRVRVEVVAAVK